MVKDINNRKRWVLFSRRWEASLAAAELKRDVHYHIASQVELLYKHGSNLPCFQFPWYLVRKVFEALDHVFVT